MIDRVLKWFSFSNVVACLALFIALGGSVYAAGKINGKQIKKSSVPGNRIKPKTIPPNRIKPESLTGNQVKANSLTSAQINEKTLTEVSAAALADVRFETTTMTLPDWGKRGTATANCPAGSYAIGGGATLSNPDNASVTESGPSPLRTGWTASASGWSNQGITMTVTAVCVVIEKPGGANTAGPDYHPAPPQGPQYNFAG